MHDNKEKGGIAEDVAASVVLTKDRRKLKRFMRNMIKANIRMYNELVKMKCKEGENLYYRYFLPKGGKEKV